jgi:cytoplasmic iron level regulating protein YaaA (DUF328/UPF0246 family)
MSNELPLVIISCGDKKLDHPAPAHQLYSGMYFQSMLSYGLSITTLDNIKIVSAKYGLIPAEQIIEPYQLHITNKRAIHASKIYQQAKEQKLLDREQVVLVSGQNYAELMLLIWPKAINILKGRGFINAQRGYLKSILGKIPA